MFLSPPQAREEQGDILLFIRDAKQEEEMEA